MGVDMATLEETLQHLAAQTEHANAKILQVGTIETLWCWVSHDTIWCLLVVDT